MSLKIISRQELLLSIEKILDHYWPGAYLDFDAATDEEKSGHIFHSLYILNSFLCCETYPEEEVWMDKEPKGFFSGIRGVKGFWVSVIDSLLTKKKRRHTPDAPSVLTERRKIVANSVLARVSGC